MNNPTDCHFMWTLSAFAAEPRSLRYLGVSTYSLIPLESPHSITINLMSITPLGDWAKHIAYMIRFPK